MTNEEKQEIVNEVLAALHTHGKTIGQLTPVTSPSDSDTFELSGGRNLSYGKLKELITAIFTAALNGYVPADALWEYIQQYVAKLGDNGALDWQESPVVMLATMGTTLDNVDGELPAYTLQEGDMYYQYGVNYQIFRKLSDHEEGLPAKTGVVYFNLRTWRTYQWTGSTMVEIAKPKKRVVLADLHTQAYPSMEVGTIAYNPIAKKIVEKVSSTSWSLSDPDPDCIYCDAQTGTSIRWDTASSTWLSIGGVADIVNNLVEGGGDKALSAEMGKVLKQMIDNASAVDAFEIIYDQQTETYNIVRVVPTIAVTSLAAMSANTKSGTFKVSGTHLKGDVTIAISATGWLLSTGGGAGASSITLSPTDGTLAETTITVTYSGSTDSVGNAITVSSNGVETQTVYATYTEYAGPTILPAENSVSLSEVAGYSDTKTLSVSGANLTAGITAALSGTNASKFSVSGTLTSSGGTLTISYNPAAGDTGTHSAVLTLSSTGATSVTVNLSGAVKTQTLSISPSTLDLSSASGTSASGTITVSGTNIKSSVSLSVGTGFTLSKNTLTATEVNAGETVTVTADTTSASATITATDGTNTATASATWSVTEEAPSVGDIITKGGLKYKVTALPDGDTPGKLTVANGDGEVPSGYKVATNKYSMADVVIPDSITYAAETYNVTVIGTSAFADCFNLKTVSIGANVKTIGAYAFYQCKNANFTSIALNNVTFIGQQAFNKCNYLANVIVTSASLSMEQIIFDNTNISNLDLSAVSSSLSFSNSTLPQTKLARLDVGAGCSSLAGGTYNCQALTTVILRKTSAITNCAGDGSGYTSFGGRKTKKSSQGTSYVPTKVYVPSELLSTYEANANWATWVSTGVIEFDTIENLPNS